jgi:hypothetical protein
MTEDSQAIAQAACRTVTSSAATQAVHQHGGTAMAERIALFDDLDADWQRFVTSPEAGHALRRWRRHEPVLADLGSVEDVLALRRDPGRADGVLRCLAMRAGRDPAAARVVLQALLPGLVRITRSCADGRCQETAGDVVAIAWERICGWPGHRAGSVAGSILLDVRRRLLVGRRPMSPVLSRAVAPSAEDQAIGGLVLDQLRQAEQTEVGSTEGLALVVASRIEGHRLTHLARERGVSAHSLVLRRRRVEQRIRRHLVA